LFGVTDLQVCGQVRVADLGQALASDNFINRSMGELWLLLSANYQSPDKWQDLVDGLVSEGVSGYLQHAEDPTHLPDGWVTHPTASIPSETFVSIILKDISRSDYSKVGTEKDLCKIVSAFAAAYNTVSYESMSLEELTSMSPLSSSRGKSTAQNQEYKYRQAHSTGTLSPPQTGTADITLVQWYYFVRWLALSSSSGSVIDRNARSMELDQLVCASAGHTCSHRGTPLQGIGTPIAQGQSHGHSSNLMVVSKSRTMYSSHEGGGNNSPEELGKMGRDEDESIIYGTDWDADSIDRRSALGMSPSPEIDCGYDVGSSFNNYVGCDEFASGGPKILEHETHRHQHHQHHHAHHAGHSGYSNYEGDSIANESLDYSDHGHYQEDFSFERTQRPGSPMSGPVIASLEDLIMTIDHHVSQELGRQTFTKEILGRCVSANASVSGQSQNHSAKLLSAGQGSQRAKSATPKGSSNARRASGNGGGRPTSSSLPSRTYPKQLTLAKLEMYGAPLRAVIDQQGDNSFSVVVVISADTVSMEGRLEFSGQRDSQRGTHNILTFDMKDAEADSTCAAGDITVTKAAATPLDLRQASNIQVFVRILRTRKVSMEPEPKSAIGQPTYQEPPPNAVQTPPNAVQTPPLTAAPPSVLGVEPSTVMATTVSFRDSVSSSPLDQLFESLVADSTGEIDEDPGGLASVSTKTVDNFIDALVSDTPVFPSDTVQGNSAPICEGTETVADSAIALQSDDVKQLNDKSHVLLRDAGLSAGDSTVLVAVKDVPDTEGIIQITETISTCPVEHILPVTYRIEALPLEDLFRPFDLSVKKFLEVQEPEFRLDFDVVPVRVHTGQHLTGELETLHLSILGVAKDFDSQARHRWSEARTPHYALLARLPPHLDAVIRPVSNKGSKTKQPATPSLLTPWFPAAINNQKLPGYAGVASHRPFSPNCHPSALNNRDPFSDGRVWNYSQEMKLRQANAKYGKQSSSPKNQLLDEIDTLVLDHTYSLLKEESPVRPVSTNKNSMLSVFGERNKYSGGQARQIPPQPSKKPSVPHFAFVKTPSDEKIHIEETSPEACTPLPRRAPTPKATDFPKIRFATADNISDGPYYAHNRFPRHESNYIPSLLGSSVPRWPEAKQGVGNMAKPRKLPPNIRMRDSPSHYKLY
jgi:hypothetical protein